MNLAPPPPTPSLLPESAPFSPAQRAWLNGFFAGMLSVDRNTATPLSPAESAALIPMPAPTGIAQSACGATPARLHRHQPYATGSPVPVIYTQRLIMHNTTT